MHNAWATLLLLPELFMQKLVVQNSFNLSQPKLSLQNFMIIVKCDASLFDNFLENVNFGKLNKLIMQ